MLTSIMTSTQSKNRLVDYSFMPLILLVGTIWSSPYNACTGISSMSLIRRTSLE